MKWEEAEVGNPGRGEVRLRHTAVGLNYIDAYHRSGLYNLPLPLTLGMEAAGVVEALGRGVTGLRVGDRVGYASGRGAYSEARLMPADRVVKLPRSISDDQGAAMMLQGMTACYLLCETYRVKPGETILVHAAAGGVGLILCQWAKHLGATVIGTVGSRKKAALARAHGCDHAIVYTERNFADRVRKITRGAGVPVVYDGVGKTTFDGSLDCLSPRGMFVSYGNASGAVPPVSPTILMTKGSLYMTRPSLVTYTASRDDLVRIARRLFAVVKSGAVKIEINQRYALKDAATAHRDMQARRTTGSTVLIP
jgi:NADPH2:quinone reductase